MITRKVVALSLLALAGGYCPDGLVEAGRVNTQAGMLLGGDLSLDFEPGSSDAEVGAPNPTATRNVLFWG